MSDIKTYELAQANDLEGVKAEVQKGGDINMAIMGAAANKHTEVMWWAFANGACLLWSMQQVHAPVSVEVFKYNKPISMLKGPGEVKKGTFKA
jgi:hypothetical protein